MIDVGIIDQPIGDLLFDTSAESNSCGNDDNLQNFHLSPRPMRERHTGEYQYNLIVAALDALAPKSRHLLI
jgi:hypothetical protein